MDWYKATTYELKSELAKRSLPTSGLKSELIARLMQTEAAALEAGVGGETPIGPDDSASQAGRSRLSKISASKSILSSRADEAANVAALKAKAAFLREKQLKQRELNILKQEMELLEIEGQIVESEAREKAYKDIQEEMESRSTLSQGTDRSVLEKKERVTVSFDKDAENTVNASSKEVTSKISSNDILETLVSYNLKSLMPRLQIKPFSGDYTQYRSFIASFDNAISSKLSNNEEKLHYLIQYTTGRPNEIASSCLHMESNLGYKEARRLLHERYGDIERISNSYVHKILSYPNVCNDDINGMDELSLLMVSCKNAMSSLKYGLGEMDHPKTLCKIIQKFPSNIQDRWRRKVYDIKEKDDRSPNYSDLVEFVVKEVKVLSHPLFGRDAFKNTAEELKDNVTCNVTRPGFDKISKPKLNCLFCQEEHYMDLCDSFKQLEHEAKLKFVRDNKLCFKCLRKGHMSKDCRNHRTCKQCKGLHPTSLHIDRQNQQGNQIGDQLNDQNAPEQGVRIASTNTERLGTGKGCMVIIPVKVRAPDGKEVCTLAFFDNGSDATFCTNELLKQLGVKGNPTNMVLSTFLNKQQNVKSTLVYGLQVLDTGGNNNIPLPAVYSINEMPVGCKDMVSTADIACWPHLGEVELPDGVGEVGLLLGNDVPQAFEPWQVINSPYNGAPHAVKTKLGWLVYMSGKKSSTNFKVNRIKVDDEIIDEMLRGVYNHEFRDVNKINKGFSQEDRYWLDKVERSCKFVQGSYEIPLPFKDKQSKLPNNYNMALKRLHYIKSKLLKNESMLKDYAGFMQDMLNKGYAEQIDEQDCRSSNDGHVWYIPHFGIYNPRKPGKIRIVFDCAAKYMGVSINDKLMQGPDLTNSLVSVLIGFRQGLYAYSADIENMFHRVKVPVEDRDFLRFLWFENGSLDGRFVQYRMKVHIFGAKSSPSCANFALRKCVKDNKDKFEEDVCNTVNNCFYVDDCLKSIDDEISMISNAHDVKNLCSMGNFKLTKFVSSSKCLLESFPIDESSAVVKDLSLEGEESPREKTLGLIWDVNYDTLSVKINNMVRPSTRRGILACIGSVYDPLGIVAPYVLNGKILLQKLCKDKLGWDDPIDKEYLIQWEQWRTQLLELSNINVPRSFKNTMFSSDCQHELHYFADASSHAYGAVCYLRSEDNFGNINCSFVFGKANVAPLKGITIPRLELSAAVLAVRLNQVVTSSLDIKLAGTYYWTDSETVLKYIMNETARFNIYVSNRISEIRNMSSIQNWRYVKSEDNPADDASRGLQSERWCNGPDFLKGKRTWVHQVPYLSQLTDTDPEVKRIAKVMIVEHNKENPLVKLSNHYSSWYRLLIAVCWLNRVKNLLLKRDVPLNSKYITLKEMREASHCVIKVCQENMYPDEISKLRAGKHISKSSSLYRLNPMLSDGILRVRGRLSNSADDFNLKYPIILPPNTRVARLMIEHYHVTLGHQGREHVLSKLREKYWLIKGNSLVRKVLHDCVRCKRYQAPVIEQQMADLPLERVQPGQPPFSAVGVDCFGPYYVKQGRGNVKRYGVLFTCLAIRAIHIEIIDSLSTDSFINALRRFIARRGQVKVIRCDRGTNFVAAEKEIRNAMKEWRQSDIAGTLLQRDVQWIFNPPYASHHGGSWERQIRTVRKVLNGVLTEQTFNHETLVTVMCEVESIINSRPLTVVSGDVDDLIPITPNHLLTLEGGPQLFGNFTVEQYSRKRWKHIQYLANLFWVRWRKEYLSTLQSRAKWAEPKRNLKEGDVVLIMDNSVPRGQWPMGRICKVKTSTDGLVRSADIKTQNGVLCRPITKLVLMIEG